MELYWYQKETNDRIADLARRGVRRIINQTPTGGGKTYTSAALCSRFLSAYGDKKIFICVHRKELQQQMVKAIREITGINPGVVLADRRGIVDPDNLLPLNSRINVCMIESLNGRLKRGTVNVDNAGMLIVDEAHLANHRKIYEYFPTSLIIGLTATPISANKKYPLNKDYDEIVSTVTIRQLQEEGFLAKNYTFTIKDAVDRSQLKMRGSDFDMQLMSKIYKQTRHVVNCRKAYEKFSIGEKALVYNCNIEHSELVTNEFVMNGYNARHLDGTDSAEYREETLTWFHETPDAILSSVDILTIGFDEPTVQTVIFNRSTMSLPLFIQGPGRGARIDKPTGKDSFKIIDLGGNVATHLDWDYPHDWEYIFKNPEKYRVSKGVAPTKECPECQSFIHMSVNICPFCKANVQREIVYDLSDPEFEVVGRGINLYAIDNWNRYSPYRTLHIIKGKLISNFRKHYRGTDVSERTRKELNKRYQRYVESWCQKHGKAYNKWIKATTYKWIEDEINRVYR